MEEVKLLCENRKRAKALKEHLRVVALHVGEIKSKIFAEVKLNNKTLTADDIWKIVDECQIKRGK